jgi:hypothetical protein
MGPAQVGPVAANEVTMPMLIIGGPSKMMDEKRDEKPRGLSSKPKFAGGIGGKYATESESEKSDEGSDSGGMDERKRRAGKLLIRAMETKNPDLAAEAVTTLVNCCSDDGDGADGESEDEDSGETD